MTEIVNYRKLGDRIRQGRKKKAMTQEKLAEAAEISVSFLGHIERGTRKASIETLVQLCKALNLSLEWLLADSLGGAGHTNNEKFYKLALSLIKYIADAAVG